MEKEENRLGTEKIGKLLLAFAIPCVISMVVNSIYNMVDQIFIGWGVGYLGNGATNIIFPLNMVCLAFALMLGDGTSAFLSLKLGEKKKDEAKKGVANGILTSIIIAIIFFIALIAFLPQIVNLFGCTDTLRPYALDYGYALTFGLPFMMIGITLNSIIRADGSPKYSMISMVSGAVLNIILDPIFIFVFKMGVKGAAIATIISQFVTFVMNIAYLRKIKSVELNRNTYKIDIHISKKVLGLGISSFITQMSVVVVMAVSNNLLRKYGEITKYGPEIPIAVLGIVMKISQILNSIIIGIVVGAQPIIGYNYGANKKERVKETLKIVLSISVIVSSVAFILFQTIPDKLIGIFGSGDENYIEFACLAFRIFLLLCICNGIQIPSGIFFQAIGKSAKSAILSLSRQILILIPSMIILGQIFGLNGVLYAGPVADGCAFILAIILLVSEMKKLSNKNVKSQTLVDDISTDNQLSKHTIITISREYGSGGRYVGRLVSDKLGIKLYDKDLIIKLSEETGLSEEYIESNEQKREVLANLNDGYYFSLNNADNLFLNEAKLIKKLADNESCVIIGRCADFILKDRKDITKIFIYSDIENKIRRATEIYGLEKSKAEKEIKRINKLRANHYKFYTERDWNDKSNYDICINSDVLGVEKTANLICDMIKSK